MAIRILAENELAEKAGEFNIPPLLFANPINLYQRRAERLRKLSENHPLGDYLNFCADLVDAQRSTLKQHPIPKDTRLTEGFSGFASIEAPLNAEKWQRNDIWITLLEAILVQMSDKVDTPSIHATIETLQKMSHSELNLLADKLLSEGYLAEGSDKALFIWAALSLYWVQLVQQIPHQAREEGGSNNYCPVCNSAPVASVVQLGTVEGVRYLHCSLCESEWHLVRTQCSNCQEGGKLNYWALDNEFAAVRAESCGDCHSYLKIMYQEKDVEVEAVADDLASLFLDDEMEKQNFAKSAINPFLFPAAE